MPRFRAAPANASRQALSRPAIAELAAELMAPAHFFVGPTLKLEWLHVPSTDVSWEVFRGRLLDSAHTRQRRCFTAWNAYQLTQEGRSEEPVLSLLWDATQGELHIVRGLDSYVWEGYESGGGVYLSRERRKWVRELAATIRLDQFHDLEDVRDELACRLFLAVVGASRLPLSSVEAPLPAFSFGELFYCYRPGVRAVAGPLLTYRELVSEMLVPSLAWRERSRLLETFLHAAPLSEMRAAISLWLRRWQQLRWTAADLAALLRTLFNEVSLSPYTDLVDKTLAFLNELELSGFLDSAMVADFLGYLLRQVGRHLTAYDLVTFHHRGANYPDALLLDAILAAYLDLIERQPQLFLTSGEASDEEKSKRMRRRALRQGYLLRRRYEGHPIPDRPTSPGENSRVLPEGHPRIPDEQILQPSRRIRRLYTGDPLRARLGPHGWTALRLSFADLKHADERRELGTALFIDRPLGGGKHPAEPDGTLLLASVAYSRSVAEERVGTLAMELGLATDAPEVERVRAALEIRGLPLEVIGPAAKPGVVSLADARRAAPDFVFLWTTPSGVRALLQQFDFTHLEERFDLSFLHPERQLLLARSPEGPALRIYDEWMRPRLELEVPVQEGYESRAGEEYPTAGLLAVRIWEPQANDASDVAELSINPLRIIPRR
jgi:hypothetical protein